mgnify:CR=1 FL=1
MPRKIEHLSKLEIGRIRSNLSRRASVLGDKLTKHALGEQEMTPSQIKAAQVVLQHVLPAQAQTQVEDVTEARPDPLDTKAKLDELAREQIIDRLTRSGVDRALAERIADGETDLTDSLTAH